ncbi:hypothetical protein [Falsiroseomonas oryzae]|uniref:hypothetical protein n=1 Tax=Falsiroseomonas oryzae TaxID=2766473 RepID=UPI0022EA793D|nr:hypothetical protein [Roseomonas sp. MO-31]
MKAVSRTTAAAVFSLALAAGASASTLTNAPLFAGLYTDVAFDPNVPNPTVAIGQIFSVPAPPSENTLVNFTLTLGPPFDPQAIPIGPLVLRAQIFEWDTANSTIGSSVWQAPTDTQIDLGAVAAGATAFTFSVGVQLDPLLTYIALLNLGGNDLRDPNNFGRLGWAILTDSSSAFPGNLAFLGLIRHPNDPSVIVPTWFVGQGFDALFTANFRTGSDVVGVPAPAALAVFGVGLAGLGMALRRRGA